MSPDELERRLRDAFDARARSSVGEDAHPPAPRFAMPGKTHRVRVLAPLAAAAAVVAVVGSVAALRSGTGQDDNRHRAISAPTAVQIKMADAGNRTYGVGMPVIAYFSHRFSSAKPLAAATSVRVDGKPVRAAWYFEHSAAKGYPIEGHLRMRSYWPAHSKVDVTIAANHLTSAAALDFRTGARTIAIVADGKHHMYVTSDGRSLGSYPVSLGAAKTPTLRGVKVIMGKRPTVRLRGPGYDEPAEYSLELTSTGEYLHAAPWNTDNIQRGVDSSNGCTNLLPKDAQLLYKVLNVGDVVKYPDARGPAMRMSVGYGDWNIPWRVWVRGGLIPTS